MVWVSGYMYKNVVSVSTVHVCMCLYRYSGMYIHICVLYVDGVCMYCMYVCMYVYGGCIGMGVCVCCIVMGVCVCCIVMVVGVCYIGMHYLSYLLVHSLVQDGLGCFK